MKKAKRENTNYPQPALSQRSIKNCFVLIFIFCLFLLSAGCVIERAAVLGTYVEDGYLLKELEIENTRFEPHGLQIQPARNYWLKIGELIAPKWDTFENHWQKEGEMCDFTDNTSTDDCQICNYCRADFVSGGSRCNSIIIFSVIQIVFDSGFTPTENPELIIDYLNGPTTQTCTSNPFGGTPPTFQPEKSGLYRFLRLPDPIYFRGETNGELGIHVVESGQSMTQTTAYQLTRQTVDGTNYWTWKTEGDSLWMENFSPNLRVTDVRFYRGICADGSMEGKQCAIPTERVPVKPSRLLFLPNFQGTVSGYQGEASHRCYGDATANSDNSIGVGSCRQTNGSTQLVQKDVTPTYEVIPDRSTEKMSWFIEFNTGEGGDADLNTPGNQPMSNDANLIIEFTIEAI